MLTMGAWLKKKRNKKRQVSLKTKRKRHALGHKCCRSITMTEVNIYITARKSILHLIYNTLWYTHRPHTPKNTHTKLGANEA